MARSDISSEHLAALLLPRMSRKLVEYGEDEKFHLNPELLLKQRPMLRDLHQTQSNMSFKKSTMLQALTIVGDEKARLFSN